jgi:hypothetical protein
MNIGLLAAMAHDCAKDMLIWNYWARGSLATFNVVHLNERGKK